MASENNHHGLSIDGTELQLATLACHVGSDPSLWSSRDVVPPICLASTFLMKDPSNRSEHFYTRVSNPTRDSLEKCLAAVEGAKYAYTFSSGVAALGNILFLIQANDHVVCTEDVYGGTYRVLTQVAPRMAIKTTFVNCRDIESFTKAFQANTKLVWLETVSNPLMHVIDLPAFVQVARKLAPDAIIVVDNTFLTPSLHKPLKYGVHIVLHSLTKYMNGHSDVLMGSVALNDDKLAEQFKFLQSALGCVPSPFCCFLANRGLRTLEVRMSRISTSTLQITQILEKNPRVDKVLYPGLPSHPQYELAKKLTKGNTGVFGLYIKANKEQTITFCNLLKIFSLAFSLGGHESLIELPSEMTHKMVPEKERLQLGITDNFLRVSIGLEDPDDLLRDLEQALISAIPTVV